MAGILHETPAAAVEAAAYIRLRHIVSAQPHPQGHTLNGLRVGADDDVMQHDAEQPRAFAARISATCVLPLSVLSMAKLVFAAISDRASSSSNRPARNALSVGSSGESPRAISSAFKNRIKPSRGSNSRASVVFPAPLQPPRMQRTGVMRVFSPGGPNLAKA